MSALTLTLRQEPQRAVDLSPLIPERLAGLGTTAIAGMELGRGLCVGDLFEVKPGEDGTVRIEGTTPMCRQLGAGMAAGRLEVVGDAGDGLGQEMAGGTLEVSGDAGAFAGAGLYGGVLRIDGDVGDHLGGALPGGRHGQAGGTILVTGSAGERAGDRMRRGRLLVAGSVGAACASRMVAGTVAVLGTTGPGLGILMRRGTLVLAQAPRGLPATFNPSSGHDLPVLPLLLHGLAAVDTRFGFGDPTRRATERWVGDMARGGLGEVLLLKA